MSDRDTTELRLTLTPTELATVVEATWDMVRDRLLRTIRPSPAWKDLNWQDVQEILDSAVSIYSQALMLFREVLSEWADGGFLAYFQLEDEVWEALAEVTKATGWPSMDLHVNHDVKDCKLCSALARTKLG